MQVWRSQMLLWREVISCSMAAMRDAKNSVANVAEPTGWPRRRQPVVSSMGIGEAALLVGWGEMENWAIVSDRDAASAGL